MKYLNLYKDHINKKSRLLKLLEEKSKYQKINKICSDYFIENYTINSDGSIDVDGDVYLSSDYNLYKLPLKFNIVTGDFKCDDCQLISLEGGPIEVGGKYNCSRNKLTTLEGAPQKVGRWFNCSNNELVSLEGGPIEVGEFYDCAHNKLVNLIGSPKEVASFIAYYNQLSSLQGAPKYVNNFNIDITYLPKIIYGKYLKEIIKWQGEYNIYRKDGSLDEERFEDMMIDIKNDVDK